MRTIARGIAITLCAIMLSWLSPMTSPASSVRSANKGDRMGSLTVGLKPQNSDTLFIMCGDRKIYGVVTYWFTPGDDMTDASNAPVETLQVSGKDRMALTVDVENDTPLMWYFSDKNGIIQYVEAYKDGQKPDMDAGCKAAFSDL